MTRAQWDSRVLFWLAGDVVESVPEFERVWDLSLWRRRARARALDFRITCTAGVFALAVTYGSRRTTRSVPLYSQTSAIIRCPRPSERR